MTSPGSMTLLEDDLRSPDRRVRDHAALQIWERYSERLLALIRRKLNDRILRREGAADVCQEIYLSFVKDRQRSPCPLRNRDELWGLLVRITICKVANTANRHRAARRDVRREVAGPLEGDVDGPSPRWMLELMDRSQPTPDEVLMLEEELERWLTPLPQDLRQVALWKLEGYTNKEISGMIKRTERAVELKLQIIRGRLEARLVPAGPPDPDPS
jgi:DNA-directed RNA polymerase specialized sigma24 family protein